MIVILVETEHHPDDRDAARAAIVAVARASRQEPGCNAYDVAIDLEDPAVTRVSELWRSLDDHRDHMCQPHVLAFFETMRTIRTLRRDFKMFEIARPIDLALPLEVRE